MQIKLAGFFRELPHGFPIGPSLRTLVSAIPQEDEARIIAYLKGGVISAVAVCTTDDVLSPRPHTLIGPLRILTDGIWEWPSDLAHYVERYHVRIPAAFVAHMRARNWQVPSESEIDMESHDAREPDLESLQLP